MRIRDGVPDDEEAIMQVHRRAILQLGRVSYTEEECLSWSAGIETGRYRNAMSSGGETFLVAQSKKKLVGFCSYKKNAIVGLYVDPAVARSGIGTQLISSAEERIANQGPISITLNAALSALAFYQSHGYRVVGRRDWTTRGGLEIDVCEMSKEVA